MGRSKLSQTVDRHFRRMSLRLEDLECQVDRGRAGFGLDEREPARVIIFSARGLRAAIER